MNASSSRSIAIRPALVVLLLLGSGSALEAQTLSQHISTRWAADMKPDAPLPEYPRPQLVRSLWTNLNGKWDYAITPAGAAQPSKWDGTIVVPFPVQSQLSGVERPVTDSQRLWYHR
ncbi:MAG: hypothetical protein ACREK8_01675, partial [Gemmatimonadales bacterium]